MFKLKNPFTRKKIEPKTARQRTLGDVVVARFVALQDFENMELKSLYVKGMTYNIRHGNDVLPALVGKWVADGKVRML